MLGYCLTLETPDAWHGFSFVASLYLTANERVALAFAALNSLEPEEAELTAAAAIGSANSPPIPALISEMDEAGFWADWATRDRLKAYCLACFTRMSEADQVAFLCYVRRAA